MAQKNKKAYYVWCGLLFFLIIVIGAYSFVNNSTETKQTSTIDMKQSEVKENKAVTSSEQDTIDAAVAAGIKAYQAGQYEESIVLLDKALQLDKHSYKALSAKGMALALEGNTKEGITLIEKAYDEAPEQVTVYYDMAIAYKLQGDLDNSQKWFQKVLKKDPQNTWTLYGIATIYADKGNKDQAMAYLQKAIATDKSVKTVAREQDHFQKYHGDTKFEELTK